MNDLATAVLAWWEEHQYDTTGPYGEYCVYPDEPEFVTLAKSISADETSLRIVVHSTEGGITVQVEDGVSAQVTIVDYHDDGDSLLDDSRCWISDAEAEQNSAAVNHIFEMHRHDQGACCECGSPDHCCCDCPTFC